MNQEIKVTRCSECPMCHSVYDEYDYYCEKGAFEYKGDIPDGIHPNCPIKGKTITFKIGDNE